MYCTCIYCIVFKVLFICNRFSCTFISFLQSPSPLGRDNSQNKRLKKYENDDIPQEQVVRIYQEELAKLMGRRLEDTMRGEQGFPRYGNLVEHTVTNFLND